MKKVVRRALSWYTRPLKGFHLSAIEALQEVLRVLKSHEEMLWALAEQSRPASKETGAAVITAGTPVFAAQLSESITNAPQLRATLGSASENPVAGKCDQGLISKEEFLPYFRDVSFNTIEGWAHVELLPFIQYCDQLHHELSQQGGAVEIGVHHGKFFISLNLFCDPEETSLAVDIFDSQHLNIDHSGQGSLAAFEANLRQHCRHGGRNVQIMAADSTRLSSAEILSATKMKPRFFSVDGGHTPEHTINDLKLASECISPAGVIFVDDILCSHWLGVIEGVGKFLGQSPTIVPSQSE